MKIYLSIIGVFFLFIMSAGAWAKANKDYFIQDSSLHQMQILEHGPGAFTKRLDLIRKAKTNINIEYFIFNDDHVGRVLTRALVERAGKGIRVRILADKLWSSINPVHLYYFRQAGIEIKLYNTKSLLKLRSVQFRNHRKMLSIDGREIIVGGRNMGDKYYGLGPAWNFLDRDLYIQGNIVKKIDSSFDLFWEHKYSKFTKGVESNGRGRGHIESRLFFDFNYKKLGLDRVEEKLTGLGRKQIARARVHSCENVVFASDLPGKKREARLVGQYLYGLMNGAEKSVLMDSAYFITKKKDKIFLENLLKKGLTVELLTNSRPSNNQGLVAKHFASKIKYFTKRGMQVFVYRGLGSLNDPYLGAGTYDGPWGLHSKSYIIDDKIGLIGSYNFDPRSKKFNAEMIAGCAHGGTFVNELKKNIHRKMENAYKLTKKGILPDFIPAEERRKLNKGLVKTFLLGLPSRWLDSLL